MARKQRGRRAPLFVACCEVVRKRQVPDSLDPGPTNNNQPRYGTRRPLTTSPPRHPTVPRHRARAAHSPVRLPRRRFPKLRRAPRRTPCHAAVMQSTPLLHRLHRLQFFGPHPGEPGKPGCGALLTGHLRRPRPRRERARHPPKPTSDDPSARVVIMSLTNQLLSPPVVA